MKKGKEEIAGLVGVGEVEGTCADDKGNIFDQACLQLPQVFELILVLLPKEYISLRSTRNAIHRIHDGSYDDLKTSYRNPRRRTDLEKGKVSHGIVPISTKRNHIRTHSTTTIGKDTTIKKIPETKTVASRYG